MTRVAKKMKCADRCVINTYAMPAAASKLLRRREEEQPRARKVHRAGGVPHREDGGAAHGRWRRASVDRPLTRDSRRFARSDRPVSTETRSAASKVRPIIAIDTAWPTIFRADDANAPLRSKSRPEDFTGAAGFIGMRLLARGDEVVGLDNLERLLTIAPEGGPPGRLTRAREFPLRPKMDARQEMERLFAGRTSARSSHLAAQAGVRYSLKNPACLCRQQRRPARQHAGRLPPRPAPGRRPAPGLRANTKMPFRARQRRPRSACTRATEEGQRADGAHLQPPVRPADHGPALLHRLRALGPADMALFLFTKAILEGGDRRVQPRQHAARLHVRRTTSSRA